MAVDKGKQFEYAIMIAALSRLPSSMMTDDPSLKLTYKDLMTKTNNGKIIEADVKLAAKNMIDRIEPSTNKSAFYKSFKQLGGGIGGGGEPKTDVLFIKQGKKYKCSLKWGDKYQLSSAGISKTSEVLKKVLDESNQIGGNKTRQEIAQFITEFENTLGTLPKKGEQAEMKRALERNTHLKAKLEQFLGTRKETQVADAYKAFKDAIVYESLTGKLIFGKSSDKTANYILNEEELKPINDKLVRLVSDQTYVRLRLKGRGKTEEGARLNELVVTIEPK